MRLNHGSLSIPLSEVYDLVTSLKSTTPGAVDPVQYHKVLNLHPVGSELLQYGSDLSEISVKGDLTVEEMAELYNTIIKRFAEVDYSIATVAKAALKGLSTESRPYGTLDAEALLELIKYNPGRVLSSWELFIDQVHKDTGMAGLVRENQALAHSFLAVMTQKLLFGDVNELEEEEFKVNVEALSKLGLLFAHYNDSGSFTLSSDLEAALIEKAFEVHCPWILNHISVSSSTLSDVLKSRDLSDTEFAVVFTKFWKQMGNIEDPKLLVEVFPRLAQLSFSGLSLNAAELELFESFERLSERLGYKADKVTFSKQEVDDILMSLTESISTGSAVSPGSLIRSFGILKRDLVQAEKLHEKFSSESPDVTSALSLVYCYHSCLEKSPELLNKAEALLGELSGVSITNLQALILVKSYLGDPQQSLDLFNQSISKISRDNSNGVSDAALITESLILGYLYNLDREFAYLIHDGAVENQVLKSDTEILRAKGLFKVYGQAFEHETEASAKDILGSHLLDSLKSL